MPADGHTAMATGAFESKENANRPPRKFNAATTIPIAGNRSDAPILFAGTGAPTARASRTGARSTGRNLILIAPSFIPYGSGGVRTIHPSPVELRATGRCSI